MSISIAVKENVRDTFKEYLKYTSRSVEEACNQGAYDVARWSVTQTDAADAEKIKVGLEAPSKKVPEAPLAAILVNRDRAAKGLKGLTGEDMKVAVEKFIRVRQSHRNFLRAGWLPAVKMLAGLIKIKRGPPIPKGTKRKGRVYGGAKPARQSVSELRPFAAIWNNAVGRSNAEAKTIPIIEQGAEKALVLKTKDFLEYIEKKQEEARVKFWT